MPMFRRFSTTSIHQTFAEPVRPSKGIIPKKPIKQKDHKSDLLRVDPMLLADQLTLYEYYLYEKVTPQECLSYTRKQSGPEVESLAKFCGTYDKLGSWVKMGVLGQAHLGRRANTIDHWIRVAEVSFDAFTYPFAGNVDRVTEVSYQQ